MKILLISDLKPLKELLGFHISATFPINVIEADNVLHGIQELKNHTDFSLIIAPYNGAESQFVKHLKGPGEHPSVLFYYDPSIEKPKAEVLREINCVASIDNTKLIEDIEKPLRDFLSAGGLSGDDSDFCPIRTSLLIEVSPLKGDVYIRLNKTKFIKMFREGDEFDGNDLLKYQEQKKIEFLYLKRTETSEFISKLKDKLEKLLAKKDNDPKVLNTEIELTLETLQEIVSKVGFTEEVQDVAKKNVQLTLKAIGTHPRLSNIIQNIASGTNYISSHSNVLAHVSCCLAKEMSWGSESTFTKLVLASFMHDIAITDTQIAKMQTMEEAKSLDDERLQEFKTHPSKSAELVRSFKELPADVDVIVLQHHERPDGSGFPRGLSHNFIAPLAAIFIIAHEITLRIMVERERFSLENYISYAKSAYTQGNFKKTLASIEKMKL
ncbi:MAG: HD domain-containing protein [Oligoflexia bacterium]|nr:HD domain-containing protein [Oligoflexia bacterium]